MKLKHRTNAGIDKRASEKPRFTVEQLDALFAAILVHDDIDLAAELPDTIHLKYSQHEFSQCYRICFQLWQEGVDRRLLGAVAKKFYRNGGLDPQMQLAFKNMRAKFKHLRFAYTTFDASHRYPHEFHRIIVKMGNLQDAFKHDQFYDMRRSAIFLRLLTINFMYAYSTWKIRRFRPTTNEAFRDHVNNEIHFIRLNLVEGKVTGRVFHEMRKVISRQVALYDNLKILYPSTYHQKMSRYLSTINGLMGSMHDELIARHFDDSQDYESFSFKVPAQIRQRLFALTEKYQSPR